MIRRRARLLMRAGAVGLLVVAGVTVPALSGQAAGDAPTRTWGIGPASTTTASVGAPRVLAILPVGDRVYVGGTFDSVIDTSGVSYPVKNLAVFSASTGMADLSFHATTNSTVTALASDGGSTLYVGGTFHTVDGAARSGLAAVDTSSGNLKDWAPGIAGTGQVDALTYAGGSVYVGGNFDGIAGSNATSQPFLAKIDATSSLVDATWRAAPAGRVRALNVAADGSGRLFLGGDFTSVSATPRTSWLAAVTLAGPGSVDSTFIAGPTNQGIGAPVYDVTSDASRVYVAAGGSGGACAALDARTGAAIWSDHANGNVVSVRLSGGRVYCGGHFAGTASFAGVSRQKLAAVDPGTGTVTSFAPNINSSLGVWSLAADGGHLYLGGDFSKVAGVLQPHYAMFSVGAPATVPQPPADPMAQAGDGVVHLSWSAPSTDGGSSLRKYKVYRSTTPGGERLTRTPLATLSDSGRSYDDTSVSNGTTYYYVIVATNSVGASPPSAEVSATPRSSTSATPPGAPQSVIATNPPGSVHLQWNPPDSNGGAPITSYEVYRGTTPGGEIRTTPVGTVSTTSFDDVDNLSAGTTYYYVVAAVNSAGTGAASAEVSATVVPGVPGRPQLSGVPAAGPAAQLSWTIPPDGGTPITKYVIVRDGVRLTTLDATASGPTAYTDTAVTSGTTYVYQVRAANTEGNGKLSNKVTITP
jgi:fibronectin type 3 domain-containing protein